MRAEDRVEFALVTDPPRSVPDLLVTLWSRRFTGSLVVHFQNGRAVYVDLGRIVRVEFDGDA